jgi:hypothetical protein
MKFFSKEARVTFWAQPLLDKLSKTRLRPLPLRFRVLSYNMHK